MALLGLLYRKSPAPLHNVTRALLEDCLFDHDDAVVCAANFNRSMEAHKVLAERGLDVASFGAASRVKLPGASRDDPNVYDFDSITYEDIASDLERQPRETVENYEARGMFEMLRRNAKIKPAPQRWQTHSDRERFDVVVCFEERGFDLVMEDLRAKGGAREGVLVVNLDVRDSHDSSVDAAPRALRLCEALEASGARRARRPPNGPRRSLRLSRRRRWG